MNFLKRKLHHLINKYTLERLEKINLLQGRVLSHLTIQIREGIDNAEFSVFSQFGDDGIIQWLIRNIEIPNKTFIEFGVEDYSESNTRFLLMNNNWSGFVMDGSDDNITKIKNSYYYWKYDLIAESAFIDKENINDLLEKPQFNENVGLLHVDIDGMDYHVWEAINCIKPIIVIVEYNSVFGADRAITVPYQKDFLRTTAHYSNLYAGTSLKALCLLANKKNYSFIGSNSAGNNAYFIRNDALNDNVKAVALDDGYVLSKLRESRNEEGELTFLKGEDRLNLIRGLPVFNVETNKIEKI